MIIRFKKINWRLLLIHLPSAPFLAFGLQQLLLIRHVEYVRIYMRYGKDYLSHLHVDDATLSRLILEFQVGNFVMLLTAILLACIALGLIAWKRNESYLLPFLLLFIYILISRTGFFQIHTIGLILTYLHGPIYSQDIYLRLVALGGVLVFAGLLPSLLTWFKKPTRNLVMPQPK